MHVETKFGKRRIVDISKSDIELFQAQLLKQGLAPKTVNDIFTAVRGVWADAFGDGILKANPLDRISNVGSDVDLEHADPFSRTEIELIGKADPDRRDDARMIEFNCWAGLSLSELIGLAIEDVDLEAGLVQVRRALVVGEFMEDGYQRTPRAWRVSCRKCLVLETNKEAKSERRGSH